jgi:hypothetical protein
MKKLDEMEERVNSATPGPWVADTGVRGDCVVWGPNGRFLLNAQSEPHWMEYPGEKRAVSFDVDKRDVEFIAAARTDVPALIAALRAVEDVLDWLEAIEAVEPEIRNASAGGVASAIRADIAKALKGESND